ncbi:MAG: hypothetical protein H6Q90_1760 [Deltaproteobacteria bacterium]|nr:hypothetical protein [Deltaproteobacteria bacterium]
MTRPDDEADRADYLWDRSGPPDPEIARLETLLSPLRHDAPQDELKLRRRRSRTPFVIAMVVAASLALVMWWRWPRTDAPAVACNGDTGFAFTARTGTVGCAGAAVASGVLAVGATLDTGGHEAELAIANIGRAELGANTRVRLDRTSAEHHQLFLEVGHLHARVSAPPRIFAVATPSAHVTDLGCEYSVDIDPSGAGEIHVITGKVELETAGGTVVVAPAGTHARLLAGRHASLPLADRAGPEITAALRALEADAPDGVARVLAAAREVDAITVANLAAVAPAASKRAVLDRLAELVPPPQPVTVDQALADRAVFELWFDEVVRRIR